MGTGISGSTRRWINQSERRGDDDRTGITVRQICINKALVDSHAWPPSGRHYSVPRAPLCDVSAKDAGCYPCGEDDNDIELWESVGGFTSEHSIGGWLFVGDVGKAEIFLTVSKAYVLEGGLQWIRELLPERSVWTVKGKARQCN